MSSAGSVCDFKDAFDETIGGLDLKVNSFCIRDVEHYRRIVAEVMDAKSRTRKRPLDYRRLRRYDVLLTASDRGTTRAVLVRPGASGSPVRYYVHNGELFDVLRASHLSTGHGGLHKMHADIGRKYANVTRPVIQTFLANCDACLEHRSRLRRRNGSADGGDGGVIVRGRSDEAAAATAEIDFADMRPCAGDDGRYRYVMTYRVDGASEFAVSRPLRAKTAAEVARNLIDVFCVFGAPATIVHHDDDRAFVQRLAERLRETTRPRVEIRRGFGGRRRAAESNADLREFLRTWTARNGTTRWSQGLRFYQFHRNNTFRPDVGRSPFEALLEKKTDVSFTSKAVTVFTGKNEH